MDEAVTEEVSPVEEVRLTVSTADDPTLPVWTFRMWFLGLISCAVMSFLNQFFSYRTEPLIITQISVHVASLPAGHLLARILPSRTFAIPGVPAVVSLSIPARSTSRSTRSSPSSPVLLNSLQEASGGKRISINDLVIKAAALALRKVPECNSSWMNDVIRQYHSVNINVAVQTEHGLFVPVIKDADKKGLSRISEEVKTLAQKAKENSLKPEDYEGGTFTVSNLGGPFGVKQFCAIVNPPQSGILAVGSAERRVVPGTGNSEFESPLVVPESIVRSEYCQRIDYHGQNIIQIGAST